MISIQYSPFTQLIYTFGKCPATPTSPRQSEVIQKMASPLLRLQIRTALEFWKAQTAQYSEVAFDSTTTKSAIISDTLMMLLSSTLNFLVISIWDSPQMWQATPEKLLPTSVNLIIEMNPVDSVLLNCRIASPSLIVSSYQQREEHFSSTQTRLFLQIRSSMGEIWGQLCKCWKGSERQTHTLPSKPPEKMSQFTCKILLTLRV